MLNSVLLYLEGEHQAEAVIRLGVSLAKRSKARVRGVTLVDTRSNDHALQIESAAYASMVNANHTMAELRQNRVRSDLTQACLKAGVNFDVRKFSGNPMQVLPQESRYHDLVVTAGFVSGDNLGLTSVDLIDLIERGVHPLLVLHPAQRALERVLLVYDGSEATGRAIRSYFNLGILGNAEHRLLVIADNEDQALVSLREMTEYCGARCQSLETGYVVGKVRRVLPSYAEKWQADLVVLGSGKGNRFFRRLFGDDFLRFMQKSTRGVLTFV